MSFSSKPILHGRDHRPGGADPIPGGTSGQTEWAIAHGHLAVSAPGAQTWFDLGSFAAYGDNATSGLYSLNLGSGSLSAIHGLGINEDGAYRAWFNFTFAGTPGDTLQGVYAGEAGFTGLWEMTNTRDPDATARQVTIPASGGGNEQYVILIFVGGNVDSTPLPSGIFPSAVGIGAPVSSFTTDVEVFIERLSDTYTGFPP